MEGYDHRYADSSSVGQACGIGQQFAGKLIAVRDGIIRVYRTVSTNRLIILLPGINRIRISVQNTGGKLYRCIPTDSCSSGGYSN